MVNCYLIGDPSRRRSLERKCFSRQINRSGGISGIPRHVDIMSESLMPRIILGDVITDELIAKRSRRVSPLSTHLYSKSSEFYFCFPFYFVLVHVLCCVHNIFNSHLAGVNRSPVPEMELSSLLGVQDTAT